MTTEHGFVSGTRPLIGIVGAGQLARMMIEAATPLGVGVRLLAARTDDSAALIWPHVDIGAPDSPQALDALAAQSTVLTFDHELVDVAQLRRLEAAGVHLYPTADTVAVAQDKLKQRSIFAERGLPVPAFRPVLSTDELHAFGEEHGWPVVAKAIRGGYDGRGVWILHSPGEAEAFLARALVTGTSLLAEAFVHIDRELAVLVARRPGGQCAVYPPVETVQVHGICHEVIAPAPISMRLADEARRLALAVAEAIGVVGIMAIELFSTGDRLLVNEIATRPHNSGHFSIEGSVTSQFENHLRAILDWPLGPTAMTAPAAVMVNLLGRQDEGDPRDRLPQALAVPGVHVHLYEKAIRPGRKIGHVTATGAEPAETRARARRAMQLLLEPPFEAEA